jgi:hypothetical protein
VVLVEYHASVGDRVKGWWRVASDRGWVIDPESPAYLGLAPHDLSDPAGVGAVLDAIDADGEEAFADSEKHYLS